MSNSIAKSGELKELVNKIGLTLKIRAFTLALFLLAVLALWITDFLPSYQYLNLVIAIISAWLASSFLFGFLLKKFKTTQAINNFYFGYAALFELGFLTFIVFIAGGIMWIGAIFYFFTLIYANIVLPKLQGHLTSLIAFLWFGGAATLQYFCIIPFISFFKFDNPLYLNFNYFIVTLSFALLAFVLSGFSANILTGLLNKRTTELEKIKNELEESKVVLEIRVRARTRELEEIANTLDEQVKERTQELQEKMTDLKRFQGLAVDRELKMIELKKDLKKLKDKA